MSTFCTDQRRRLLTEARRMVVKVGSAVLTSENGLNGSVVDSLAAQIAALHDAGREIILVSSGAVAAGRGVLRDLRLSDMPHRQAASAIGQSRLMHAYDQAFAQHGKVSAQVLLTRDDLRSRRRFLNARNTFMTLLAWRAIPVVNENDTVVVRELEFGDNDSLACLLLNLTEADLFVNLTSARGVYAANPDTCAEEPHCLEHIENVANLDLNAMCGGKTSSGSGGMYSKLLSARRAAELGLPTLILSGKEPNALGRVFAGEALGTWVSPRPRKLSGRKFWLAYNDEPKGSIAIDAGAARAVGERGTSLLPAGVVNVSGSFGRGALIRIIEPVPEGERLVALGLSNYSSAQLKKISGMKTRDIETVLGPGMYAEAVHRDNMVVDPAF